MLCHIVPVLSSQTVIQARVEMRIIIDKFYADRGKIPYPDESDREYEKGRVYDP